jgi:toxin FitB
VILFDTNIWSVLRQPYGHENVANWVAERLDEAWLSVIVIAEIRMGIENPHASRNRDKLEQWLSDLEVICTNRILDFDVRSAHLFGALVVRRKLQKQETKLLDIQIAAQGLAHNWPVATRNVKDFEWTGVKLVNPWEG